ncbi:MAG TPA: putrescine-ornithine antiporter [Burkholderiales bacterium]|nr:putrescine-ornithine antiporter [Burkholderiales bacterium]
MATSAKKMSMMQLTVVVAVNMMGSGIIMLPTNMAKVGAISLLSWIVTALGSMAIAYGFAQAGLFNQRPGGMAAYAEDAYGKDGYFLTFLLYFFSLAIGNVAIAISAVGYLAGFFPGMSATPIATCVSVIALIWLTTVANFGGPSITGKIGAITVWGVIVPVAGLSVIGWFWFSGATFGQAWNPKGMPLLEGMGSSIALTLWAFLGMESAAQNSDAVENPKRDVPLACMLGTLGAAVVYVLSTSVIQGIVPNEELAKSTGPFALAYAKMFNPTIGSIIMALAVIACLGSLLGWQFTIAQTAKTAAADRFFPAVFSRENRLGAPIAGMVIMGVVQTLMALSTISPSLSEQFNALVNLAVVTNVIPYIISLSALVVMMKKANVAQGTYRLNVSVMLVAVLYSTYAIYASGKDAVLGGTIVLALTYILYGFLAPRFTAVASAAAGVRMPAQAAGRAAAAIVLALAAAWLLAPRPAQAQSFVPDKLLTIGYYADARPLSYENESGKPVGYAVEICQKVIELTKGELGLADVQQSWVPVTLERRLALMRDKKVQLVCGEPVTLSGRKEVAYSIAIFQSGVSALLRADAPAGLAKALAERPSTPDRPLWRGTPTEQLLQTQTFAVVGGTPTEKVLANALTRLQLASKVAPVKSYGDGVQAVLDRKANVFFAERSILLDAVKRNPSYADLKVIERRFTVGPVALALPRGNEDARLAVDRALSRLYGTPEFRAIYVKWFGEPDADTLTFFRLSALPE